MNDSGVPSKAMPSETPVPPRRLSIRWWPAFVIGILGFASMLITQRFPHLSQQHANIDTAKAIVVTGIALLLWLLFLSRMAWKRRIWLFAGIVVSLGALASMFRIRGVSGNLVPVLEPRWVKRTLEVPIGNLSTNTPMMAPGVADFPQFLGSNRDGSMAGPRLATNWTARPPTLLWRHQVGSGWSGFVVSGTRAITQEQRDQEEATVCYDLITGKVIWAHSVRARYFNALAGEGPRATPTIAGSKVFAQGATGVFVCLDLETGHELWIRDLIRSNHVEVPAWGVSSSPLAVNDLVVLGAGGGKGHALEAYVAKDGSAAWAGGNEGDTYSSPKEVTLDGVPQIVLFSGALVGHELGSGQELWRFPWPGGHPHIAMPIVASETDLIISSGYGTGSGRIRIKRDPAGKWTATSVWRANRLKAKFTNPLLHRGNVYGLDDGILACMDAETGNLRWKDGRYGHGQTLLVGSFLLIMAESGEAVLVDPQPDQLRELTRFQAVSGKTWNPHALAGEYLIVRNDKEAACYRLPVD